MPTLTLDEARHQTANALQRAGASVAMAQSTAQALVLAEAQGLGSHGLSRVAQYAAHLRHGRVDGQAVATVVRQKGAVAVVDAKEGLAFPACALAVEEALARAGRFGAGVVGVINSHHAGVMVDHLRPVAAAGLVGLALSNSPAAMPAAGGRHAIFGTNPVAAIFPRGGSLTPRAASGHEAATHTPLMIDLSLSEVARGKLMVAAKECKPIPLGWALDAQGQPTTDPNAALHGSMLPLGSGTAANGNPKGAMLALMVELLVSALVGANFGFEASSFFVDEGNRPRLGQLFIVIDPGALAGREDFFNRVEVLVAEMLSDADVRLPGARREALRRNAEAEGLSLSAALLASWAA